MMAAMVISNWVEKKLAEREKRREQELIARVRAETEARVRPEAFANGRAYERERIADAGNGDDAGKAIADSLLRNDRNDHVSTRIDADKMQA